MTDRELDRILSAHSDLAPSSGFTASVMEKVKSEAAGLSPNSLPPTSFPPLSFPWTRALPGLVAWVVVLALTVFAILKQSTPAVHSAQSHSFLSSLLFNLRVSDLGSLLHAASAGGLDWMVLALLLTVLSVMLSMRFARSA